MNAINTCSVNTTHHSIMKNQNTVTHMYCCTIWSQQQWQLSSFTDACHVTSVWYLHENTTQDSNSTCCVFVSLYECCCCVWGSLSVFVCVPVLLCLCCRFRQWVSVASARARAWTLHPSGATRRDHWLSVDVTIGERTIRSDRTLYWRSVRVFLCVSRDPVKRGFTLQRSAHSRKWRCVAVHSG